MQAAFIHLCLLSLCALSSAEGQGAGHVENYEPSPYRYEYKVHDDKEYLDFGAEEEGDGKGDVHGEYHVQLPDGRLQHVTYRVDDYSGYIAEVSYDGHAEHPSYHGNSGHGDGHRFGKALSQTVGAPSISQGSGSSRLGKSLAGNIRKHSFSDDFFGSSSRSSLSSPSETTLIKNEPNVPESREASFDEPTDQFLSQNSETKSSRRTFISKPFGLEKQQQKPVKHEIFQHKPEKHTFPTAGNFFSTLKHGANTARKFVSKPSSFESGKATTVKHENLKTQETNFTRKPTPGRFTSSLPKSQKARNFFISEPSSSGTTKTTIVKQESQDQNRKQPNFNSRPKSSRFTSSRPESHKARKSFFDKPFSFETQQPKTLKNESSGSRGFAPKSSGSQSNHFQPTPAATRKQVSSFGTLQSHPVVSSINSLRSDPVGHKNLKHKSSLIVHRPLPTN